MKRTVLVSLAAIGCGSPTLCPVPPPIGPEEHLATIEALRPPKRDRPVVAVLGASSGTETTDYVVPYAVLSRSLVAEVVALGTEPGPMDLMPALTVVPDRTLADFDAEHPDGADYVVVPALHHADDPEVLAWLLAQHEGGATIVGVCSGAKVLAHAGLLDDHRATGHWYDLGWLDRHVEDFHHVPDRRYVVDRGVVTTTGITASIPVSLALVEAIAGPERAAALAAELGVDGWDASHDSSAFAGGDGYVGLVVGHALAFWNHEAVAIPVADGVDDVSLALAADAWSRTGRSHAETVGPASVTTASGLELRTDRDDAGHADLWPLPDHDALGAALSDIDADYGPKTAAWVARQLEYPGWCAE